jgi:hypothetical protein
MPADSITRFPDGVTNAREETTLGAMGFPDPTRYHTWFNDFDDYLAAEWVRTVTGTGTTVVNTGADGGILLTTNSAADDDAVFYQLSENAAAGACETFKFIVGKKLWFKARLAISDATQSDFVMGLQVTDTTPLAVTDGVYFRKDDGDAFLDFVVIKGSVATTATVIATMANATFITMGFYYDGGSVGATGTGNIYYYVNDVLTGRSAVTNVPDTEELTISFGIQNGEAVAKTQSVDYIFVSKER